MKEYVESLKELHKIDREFNTVLDEVMKRPDVAKQAIQLTIEDFKQLIEKLKELMKGCG